MFHSTVKVRCDKVMDMAGEMRSRIVGGPRRDDWLQESHTSGCGEWKAPENIKTGLETCKVQFFPKGKKRLFFNIQTQILL